MDIVGAILGVIGSLGIAITGIWLIVCAFKKSIVWGLLYLFIPFASMVYVVIDWNRAGKPFLICLASTAVFFGGIALSPTMQKAMWESRSTTVNRY